MTQIDTRPTAAKRAESGTLPARREFTNFTDADKLRVSPHASETYVGSSGETKMPALVTLNQSAGSMDFQLSMRPDQARELGRFLIECADALDAMEGQK